MPIKRLCIFACAAAVNLLAARATLALTANFNLPADAANWKVNVAPAANTSTQSAEFGFDYSVFGIPAAPGSVGSGDTLGLRLRANIPGTAAAPVTTRPAGVLSGLSVSPIGQSFGANYQMTVYAWSNFCGAPNAMGLADNANSEGGTNNVMFAVGTTGNAPLVVGNTTLASGASMDGIGFATTGDGGITNDYRVYPVSGTIVPGTTAGVYAAGSNLNSNAYYTTLFPPVTAPTVQQTLATEEYGADLLNPQEGMTQAGAFGFAWHKVVVTKNGTNVTWDIDNTRIATYNASTVTPAGSNIALGVSDVNTSTTRHPSLVFTVFDNLTVTSISSPGDFNNDGFVNAADYTTWRDHLGQPTETSINGQGDGLNGVDQADYLVWRDHFGMPGSGANQSVPIPEPASLLLLLVCAGGYSWRPRSGL